MKLTRIWQCLKCGRERIATDKIEERESVGYGCTCSFQSMTPYDVPCGVVATIKEEQT